MSRELTLSISTIVCLISVSSCAIGGLEMQQGSGESATMSVSGVDQAPIGKWVPSRESDPADLEGHMKSVYFIDEKNGWAAGDYGVIVSTKNGGVTWAKLQNQAVNKDLWDIHFVDGKAGWASGESGTIICTKDGGRNWMRQDSVATVALYGIYFLDANNGWAVGGNSTIVTTKNAGTIWEPTSGGKAAANIGEGAPGLWDVHFVTLEKGWVVGSNGTIRMTEDGGQTWVEQNNPEVSGIDSNLSTLDFVNETTGWIVGEGGTILHTTDSGSTWTAQNSGVTEWLHGVDFISDKEGVVSGEYGTILSTVDGGKTWKIETSGKEAGAPKYTFFDVSFPSPKAVYATGEWGMILKCRR